MNHTPRSGPLLDLYEQPPTGQGHDRFVIFDRDETLIRDLGYTHRIEDLQWRPGALRLLRDLTLRGVLCLIATNQSGLARGYFSREQQLAFNGALIADARAAGAQIAAICSCPHLLEAVVPEYDVDCECRKPLPGLFLELKQTFHLVLDRGIAVGDKESDWEAARAAGIESVDARPDVGLWRHQVLDWCGR